MIKILITYKSMNYLIKQTTGQKSAFVFQEECFVKKYDYTLNARVTTT